MNIPKIICTFSLLISAAVWGQEWSWAERVSSGFRSSAKVHYVEPSDSVKVLKVNDSAIHPDVKKIIDGQIKRLPTRALVVAKGDQIYFEYYSSRSSRRWTPLGYSMSKSLTAMTVGKALCDGSISSIDDTLEKYIPELSGTSWGAASIKNVLMMSSGSYKTDIKFNGMKSEASLERTSGRSLYNGKVEHDFIDIMKSLDDKELIPGERFYYNNMDTIALGLLVEAATGKKFYEYFENAIWKESGGESRGAWIVNNLDQTSTYQGFSATPHDWVRLGLYVLESRAKDDCFGKFLVEGTQSQLPTYLPIIARNYGFQIWVNCQPEVDFCFVGHGRQYLWFNLRKNVVMYHHAATDTLDMGTLLSVFMNVLANID